MEYYVIGAIGAAAAILLACGIALMMMIRSQRRRIDELAKRYAAMEAFITRPHPEEEIRSVMTRRPPPPPQQHSPSQPMYGSHHADEPDDDDLIGRQQQRVPQRRRAADYGQQPARSGGSYNDEDANGYDPEGRANSHSYAAGVPPSSSSGRNGVGATDYAGGYSGAPSMASSIRATGTRSSATGGAEEI
jgi:HAMP domain-containing protein